VFGGVWHHLHGHRWAANLSRQNLSPEERRVTGESVESLTAGRFVEEQLGGIEAERLLPDDHPRSD
jgi:hypothetical protein